MLMFLNGLKYILQLLKRYRWFLFSLIYAVGFYIYYFLCKFTLLPALFYTTTLFTLNLHTDTLNPDKSCVELLYVMGLIAGLYTVLNLISLFAKKYIDKRYTVVMQNDPYVLVCGFGKKASAYIKSELKDNNTNIIVIEKNESNPNIEKYRQKGLSVIVGDAKDKRLYSELKLDNIKYIVVFIGSDIDNLEVALSIKEVLLDKQIDIKRLFIHINDRSIDKFYKDGGLLDDSSKLEIKMFSMAKNASKSLFLRYDIDGLDDSYIKSETPFSLVIVGNNLIALEMIGTISQLAHFPFENKVHIYCIDKDIKSLKQKVLYQFPNISNIPNIIIKFCEMDYLDKGFYEDSLWYDNVTNVVLCRDDAQSNLDISAELADRTYLSSIIDGSMKTMIHIATYDNEMVAKQINQNREHFKYFNAFAVLSQTLSKDVIVDETFEQIAKYIHSGYAESYDPYNLYQDDEHINQKWYNKAKLTDRESNLAQAYHIPIKLKTLGLTYQLSKETDRLKILNHNRKLLNQVLEEELKQLGFDEKHLTDLTKKYTNWDIFKKEFTYFPKTFDLLIEKLIRMEKNRWNAYHYLKGWEYTSSHTNKAQKLHRCLIPIEQMHKEDRFTILYDLYSVL